MVQPSSPSSHRYLDDLKKYIDSPVNKDVRIVLHGKEASLHVGDKALSQKTDTVFSRLFSKERILEVADTKRVLEELAMKLADPNHRSKEARIEAIVSSLYNMLTGSNPHVAASIVGAAARNYRDYHGIVSKPDLEKAAMKQIKQPPVAKDIARYAPHVIIENSSLEQSYTIKEDGIECCLDAWEKASREGEVVPNLPTSPTLDSETLADTVEEFRRTHDPEKQQPSTTLTNRLLACMSGDLIGAITTPLSSQLRHSIEGVASPDKPISTSGDISFRYVITEDKVDVHIQGTVGLVGEKEQQVVAKLRKDVVEQKLTKDEKKRLENERYLAKIPYSVVVSFTRSKPKTDPTITIEIQKPTFKPDCDERIKQALS